MFPRKPRVPGLDGGISRRRLLAAAVLSGSRLSAATHAICVSRQASPSEKRAAGELQLHLGQMTGEQITIITDDQAAEGQPVIAVGESEVTRRMGISPPTGESFLLRSVGHSLVIAGGRERGTMYGVYAFLERLGVRWFTRDITRMPHMHALTLPTLNETESPAFEYREPFFTEALDKDWAARNRTNGNFQHLDESTGGRISYAIFVHSFNSLVPPEKYFKDHPEYFSLIEGRRRSERSQLCLTNREVLNLVVEQVRRRLDEHPEARIISVSQNDWYGWCECDACRRVEADEGGAHSGPLLRFVNSVAAEIAKTHPDKLIDTLAYQYTEEPPANVRPRPNVRIRLCPIRACEAHPYEKCERNAFFMRTLGAWSKITNQLYIWHYNTNFRNFLFPFPDYDELAADIPMYKRHGVVGLFLEGAVTDGGRAEDAELRSYIMARLLWNPAVNVQREIDEFLAEVYGPAAKTMRAYFDLRHQEVRRGAHIWINQYVDAPYLTREFLAQGRELLSRAATQAVSDAARLRVRNAMLSIDYVETHRAKRCVVQEGAYGPHDLEMVKTRFNSLVASAKELGITNLREGEKLETHIQEFNRNVRRYPMISIESATLRACVVPELNARVVSLVDRKTGRNLLRSPDPGESGYPDLGGQFVSLHADFGRRLYPLQWQVASSSAAEVVLEGTAANGLRARKVLRMEGAALVLHASVENPTSNAIPLVVQVSAEITGDLALADVARHWVDRSGGKISGTFHQRGMLGTGTETLTGDQQPAGEWRFAAPSTSAQLTNRFDVSQVSRCTIGWSVIAGNRAEFSLWTPESDLQPGQKVDVQTQYLHDPLK